PAVRQVLEDVDRIVGILAAHQVEDRAQLAHRRARESPLGPVENRRAHFRAPVLAALPPWPRKVRVGANSPSLCPTLSSVTYSLMNVLPLWMVKFLPMNSGTIVHARAQVLIGSRLPVWSALYTRSSNRSTTYGPFFSERPMSLSASARMLVVQARARTTR